MKNLLPFALFVAGCGGASTPMTTPTSNPQPVPDVVVAGQYNLQLTSTNGHGTTNVYTNFSQTGKTFTGSATTSSAPPMMFRNAREMIHPLPPSSPRER